VSPVTGEPGPGNRRLPPRGTATFLAAGCVFAVAWLAALLSRGDPAVGLLAAFLVVTVGVLALVGAALYLVAGPRRRVPVRRVVLVAGVAPAVVVLLVAALP
jgi:threonine/homoserine/homoserine lactone efflux protein